MEFEATFHLTQALAVPGFHTPPLRGLSYIESYLLSFSENTARQS